MKSIETGVDKLVALINKEKKIEMKHAAKTLGVSTVILQEWAEFLEQEKLISIDYGLSKTYLVERQLSQKEVEYKAKQFAQNKDLFIRKVENALQNLDKETIGFQEIKKEFLGLQNDIGGEIEEVKDDLKELQHYADLKNNLDKEIKNQQNEYKKLLEQSHRQIKLEQKRYQEILQDIEGEKEVLDDEKKDVLNLDDYEKKLSGKLADLTHMVDELRGKIKDKEDDVQVSEEHLVKLSKLAESIESDIRRKKETVIAPLIKTSEEHQSKVMNVEQLLLDKIKAKKKEMSQYAHQGEVIAKKFEDFFKKRASVYTRFEMIDKERDALKHDLQILKNKAIAFNVASSKKGIAVNVAEMEKKFQDIEKRKNSFQKKFAELTDYILGKKTI